MSDIFLTETDNHGSFNLRINETITINLEENRSTAYMWQGADRVAGNVLALVRDDYMLPQEVGFGSSGMRILNYETKGEGTVDVELHKRREWEPNDAIESFTISVTVKA